MLTKEETKSNVPGSLICPICGKRFRKPPASVYKRQLHGKTWKCVRTLVTISSRRRMDVENETLY